MLHLIAIKDYYKQPSGYWYDEKCSSYRRRQKTALPTTSCI